MTRATRPGSIQSAVSAAIRAVGGIENAATDLGIAISTLSYGTEISETRPGGLGVNYLDRLGRIDSAAAKPVAEHFAHLSGCVLYSVDYFGVTAADMSRLTREFSDVLSVDAAAHAASSPNPEDYTADEARAQIKEIDELVEVAMKLRAALAAKAGAA